MGGINSTRRRSDLFDRSVRESYPSYFIENVVLTHTDEELTSASWSVLMSGNPTDEFKARKKDPAFQYISTLTWFYDTFYNKFFEVCPDVKPMFANVSIVHQGKLLATVIGSALNSMRKPAVLRKKLLELAKGHNGKGVKAAHYGGMGSALIWSLELVLGKTILDEATKTAWIRMYSFMLTIMVPEAVSFEMGFVLHDIEAPKESNGVTLHTLQSEMSYLRGLTFSKSFGYSSSKVDRYRDSK